MPAFSVRLEKQQFKLREVSFFRLHCTWASYYGIANMNTPSGSLSGEITGCPNEAKRFTQLLDRLDDKRFYELIECILDADFEVYDRTKGECFQN